MSGGTMATLEFVDQQSINDIRGRLEQAFPNGVSIEQLTLAGDGQKLGRLYRIRTSEIDRQKVIAQINTAFSDNEHAIVRVGIDDIALSTIGELKDDSVRFSGGSEARVKLNGGMSAETFLAYVVESLESNPASSTKYASAQSLLQVKGLAEASKAPAAPVDSKQKAPTKYTELLVQATPEVASQDLESGLKLIQERLKTEPVLDEVNSFDTSVAAETKWSALSAVLASLVMIVVYIWFRFEKVYFGIAAVVALAHDVLVTLGAIAIAAYLSKTPIGPLLMLEDFKINMNQIACLLTIVGYSLNDTIVIFDRIREIKGKNPNITYNMINLAVNQTLSRTLLTALTTFLVVLVLYVAGGEGIHGFAFSMIIGVITGCYSTVYIANPVLLWLVNRELALKSTPQRVSGKLGKSGAA